jgi:hypothetical protein
VACAAAHGATIISPLSIQTNGENAVPRARKLFPIALSIEAASKAIACPARVLRAAIYQTGELPAYRGPSNNITRVLVRDLENWIATTWPRATIARQIRKVRSVPND